MKSSKVSIPAFRAHLLNLLPMRNPSYVRGTAVEIYSTETLTKLGRRPNQDKHGNITHIAGNRAIVAHTDSVDQKGGKSLESVIVKNGIIRSRRMLRPIGGDDKVGIAIALTIAAVYPDISVLLFADEEVGCAGSHKARFDTKFDFAVQCDRKGANDVVFDTHCGMLASDEAVCELKHILPHREESVGSITDVVELVGNGHCHNAINLSCGYYRPHSNNEYIVLSHAIQALLDAEAALVEFPQDIESCIRLSRYAKDQDDWAKDYKVGSATNDPYSWADFHEGYEKAAKRTIGNWEEWEQIQQCQAGPFSDDAPEWFETREGGYANTVTGETISAEAVQLYYAYLADNVSNAPFARETPKPAAKVKQTNIVKDQIKATLRNLRTKGA